MCGIFWVLICAFRTLRFQFSRGRERRTGLCVAIGFRCIFIPDVCLYAALYLAYLFASVFQVFVFPFGVAGFSPHYCFWTHLVLGFGRLLGSPRGCIKARCIRFPLSGASSARSHFSQCHFWVCWGYRMIPCTWDVSVFGTPPYRSFYSVYFPARSSLHIFSLVFVFHVVFHLCGIVLRLCIFYMCYIFIV